LMKESMIRTVPIAETFGGRFVQTIHDELVFDLPLRAGWVATLIRLKQAMEDWPMFSDDHLERPEFAPGRYGVPIKTSIELTTTTWEEKREIVFEGGSFSWVA